VRLQKTVGTAAAIAALLSLTAIGTPALAATKAIGKPSEACSGGPFLDVTANYGKVFQVTSPTYVVHNKNAKTVNETLTNTVSKTVSASVDGNLGVSLNFVVVTVSSQVGVTGQMSWTTQTGIGVAVSVPAHEYGNGQYGVFRQYVALESYYLNGSCNEINQKYATAYVPVGPGWTVWVSKN
jgi:hypothetical protein